MKHKNDGYVLLEVMMALVVLLCGMMVAVDSYRASLRTERESVDEYRAALLLEARLLELEKSKNVDLTPENDSALGALTWDDVISETDTPDWKEHHLTLSWGETKDRHALELSTYLP